MSKENLNKFSLLVASIAAVALVYGLWWLLDLPKEKEIIALANSYFERYGLITVLISAVLEGLILIGVYYPGSLVIFLAVIFAAGDVLKVAEVVIVATLGVLIAYVTNYLLGQYGWYKLLSKFGLDDSIDEAKKRLEKHQKKALILTYWHPNFAALTSTAAGILGMNFYKFFALSALVALIWNIFWGTLAAILGEASLAVMGLRFIMVAFAVWALYIYMKEKDGSKISP